MDLYSYVSIESFVRGCKEPKTPGTFTLRVPNLLYAKPDEITGYGLSLLRRSIVLHEEQNGIKQEFSKQNIPFFRENRRMLIGPEIEMYAGMISRFFTRTRRSLPVWRKRRLPVCGWLSITGRWESIVCRRINICFAANTMRRRT
jgi:hypothetical protein